MQCVNINTMHTCVWTVYTFGSAHSQNIPLSIALHASMCVWEAIHIEWIYSSMSREKNSRIHVSVNFSYGAPTYTRNTSEQQSWGFLALALRFSFQSVRLSCQTFSAILFRLIHTFTSGPVFWEEESGFQVWFIRWEKKKTSEKQRWDLPYNFVLETKNNHQTQRLNHQIFQVSLISFNFLTIQIICIVNCEVIACNFINGKILNERREVKSVKIELKCNCVCEKTVKILIIMIVELIQCRWNLIISLWIVVI